MADKPADDVVRAITTTNYAQAHIWEQALRDEGIRCQVVGDYLTTGGFGGVSGVPAEIWVHQDDLARAKEILEEVNAAPEEFPPQEQEQHA